MTDVNHEINLALRTAAGHERAAREAEAEGNKQYEMKMKSAGASAFAGFVLAIKAAPDYQGRKIDDAAIKRIYESTKPRPWWDQHLAKVKAEGKPATREWAKRVIQWHLDPEAAIARRALQNSQRLSRAKSLKERAERAARGGNPPQVYKAPTTAEFRSVATAMQEKREPASMAQAIASNGCTMQDVLGELNRIRTAVSRFKEPAQFNEAVDLLKAVARDIERLG